MQKLLVLVVLISVFFVLKIECGKRGGGYSYSKGRGSSFGGSKTRGSSSYGSKTKIQGSKVSKSKVSVNSKGNSPSVGMGIGAPNQGSAASGKNPPSYSSVVGNGPPPAYPGLGNQPVNSRIFPPGYSSAGSSFPGYGVAPAYAGPSYVGRQANYRPSYMTGVPSYPMASPMYVNNYNYNTGRRNNFVSSLFTAAFWYNLGSYRGSPRYWERRWDYEEEKKWRATTKAPFFENKVPGEDMFIPASAVFSATHAFGLYSLLPLYVPTGKPLLSCNSTFLNQVEININDQIYTCNNGNVELACPLHEDDDDDSMTTTEIIDMETTTFEDTTYEYDNDTDMAMCVNERINCTDIKEFSQDFIECFNNTLIAHKEMICNSTAIKHDCGEYQNETRVVLECVEGVLPESERIMLPTKSEISVTEIPTTTPETGMQKFKSSVYSMLMWGIGRPDLLETTTTTEAPPREFWEIPYLSNNSISENKNFNVSAIANGITVSNKTEELVTAKPLDDNNLDKIDNSIT